MKKLSDYKGEESIELWVDLVDSLIPILTDENVRDAVRGGASKATIAKMVLKGHLKETEQILLRIDPTPLDGLNIIIRLVELFGEIGQNQTIMSFFGFAEQEETGEESYGSVTESTEDEEK